jgi:CHAT domain-containing protein
VGDKTALTRQQNKAAGANKAQALRAARLSLLKPEQNSGRPGGDAQGGAWTHPYY